MPSIVISYFLKDVRGNFFKNWYTFSMNIEKKKAYLHYLKNFVTKERQEKIKSVLALRTRHVTVALEDVCHSQNVAAIMRTCEAMGLQDMYAIEVDKTIDIKTNVARGSIQWMNLYRYHKEKYEDPLLTCIQDLKQKGYTVVATSPHASKKLSDLPIDKKIAFVFGTENFGLSDQALQAADEQIALPQYGFVESFNVAVAAALCVYDVVTRLRASQISWHMSPEELFEAEIAWMEHSIERSHILKTVFLDQYKAPL